MQRGARAGALLTPAAVVRQSVRRALPDPAYVRTSERDAAARHLRTTQRSMLHHTLSPATAHPADFLSDDGSSDAHDTPDDLERAEFKLRRRNYFCAKCQFYTQNPRSYLEHTRDVHLEKIRIYECTRCIYASKFSLKLQRHMKMVHGVDDIYKMEFEPLLDEAMPPQRDEIDRYEDLLEEVEEIDDEEVEDVPDSSKAKKEQYTCKKCSYATHVRSRYTKHVKYHSMPMIKCVICDFRTPYKWNLDRHMKNHGGSGAFHCSMCNFTADIKQSLTVHEMNHHASSAGQSVAGRRRNRVGASDIALADKYIELEEEGSSDSALPTSDMVLQIFANKEMANSDSNDGTSQNNKDLSLKRDHSDQDSPSNTMDEGHKQKKKPPRPLPQLIPLNTSTPNQSKATGEPPTKKFKESSNDSIDSAIVTKDVPDSTPITTGNKDTTARNKNQSFFDRLKERILTESGEEGSLVCKNCGFESKCLSEHSVHEKNCSSPANKATSSTLLSTSTRCKNCRHRCKSSADLVNHMKTCLKIATNHENQSNDTNTSKNEDDVEIISLTESKQLEPHPMENKVFVWNNFNMDTSKFDTPLGISINDDSTLPDRSFDAELIDDNEGMNLSPSQAIGKKVFKCPHCQFWASTASRFHVHIVGHLNKKPFECSLCKYKSNWRWDITKHIKLKSARDPFHNDAKVLMTDETGRRNYSKYNRFLAMPVLKENGSTEFLYIDQNASMDLSMDVDDSNNEAGEPNFNNSIDIQPLNLQTQHFDQGFGNNLDVKKAKKTLWKCKRCNYKDSSKDALLEHVREHSSEDTKPAYKKPENLPDPADLAYRCGHCNQLSNWKHVIQRHCRLKHDGIIKVITTVKPKPDEPGQDPNEVVGDTCNKCPYKSEDKQQLIAHLHQHQPSALSIFKCYFCNFFVKTESELNQHLLLHGISDPEEYVHHAKGSKSPNEQVPTNKRHKCTECPYETNSKSQYQYHEQFHRLPADTPYKCPECNYSVSKRHLLHQHLRVHGIIPKKSDLEDHDLSESINYKEINLDVIPFVWVSAKDEFHKMFKCRYCSYVNSQKCNISTHEKIHCTQIENSDVFVYKCLECKFACRNARVLALHSKSHGEIYGRIYCPVEDEIPEEDQIAKLRKVVEIEKQYNDNSDNADSGGDGKEMRILFFCQRCPARYFNDKELKAHDKHHDLKNEYKCPNCKFSIAQENDLIDHATVHTDEYNTKTKILKFTHNSHMSHQPPSLLSDQCPTTSAITWIVEHPGMNYEPDTKRDSRANAKFYPCKECPAKFYKSSALNYHSALHNGEGEYKCKKCTYSVKNSGNLTKHELLHETENNGPNCDYESGDDADYKNIPISGTDLFQRKTEAQKKVSTQDKLVKPNDHFPPVLQADPQFGYLMHGNPDFVYPTYMKNGRQKEKRYKCHKCPSAFEKREQYKIHLSLHGSKQRYKCEICDYSVKYYANYVQHMRKHQINDEAVADRKKSSSSTGVESQQMRPEDGMDSIKLAIKTMPKATPKTDFQQFAISDQQTLRLLQRRRSLNNALNDTNTEITPKDKERKMHVCLLCPYKNQRQDALATHYSRHERPDEMIAASSHACPHCGLVVVQTHFMRDHLKTHFSYHKNLAPECYAANEDVSFVIMKEDGGDSELFNLKFDVQDLEPCDDKKLYVKLPTGEIVV